MKPMTFFGEILNVESRFKDYTHPCTTLKYEFLCVAHMAEEVKKAGKPDFDCPKRYQESG